VEDGGRSKRYQKRNAGQGSGAANPLAENNRVLRKEGIEGKKKGEVPLDQMSRKVG